MAFICTTKHLRKTTVVSIDLYVSFYAVVQITKMVDNFTVESASHKLLMKFIRNAFIVQFTMNGYRFDV